MASVNMSTAWLYWPFPNIWIPCTAKCTQVCLHIQFPVLMQVLKLTSQQNSCSYYLNSLRLKGEASMKTNQINEIKCKVACYTRLIQRQTKTIHQWEPPLSSSCHLRSPPAIKTYFSYCLSVSNKNNFFFLCSAKLGRNENRCPQTI